MSVASLSTSANWDCARDALAELVAGRGELEQFLEGLFGEFEKLGSQLEERQRALAAQWEQLERHRAAIQQPKERTDEVRREVAETAAELAEAMVQQRRQMAEERARWLEELTRMRQLLELVAHHDMNHPTN